MGEIPNKPLFSVQLWLAIALVATASVRVFGVQVPTAQAATIICSRAQGHRA
jgi:hypothetical protein